MRNVRVLEHVGRVVVVDVDVLLFELREHLLWSERPKSVVASARDKRHDKREEEKRCGDLLHARDRSSQAARVRVDPMPFAAAQESSRPTPPHSVEAEESVI